MHVCLLTNGEKLGQEDGGGSQTENGWNRTATWLHPLLSRSWQRHGVVTDRHVTLLWLIKPSLYCRRRTGRRLKREDMREEQRNRQRRDEGRWWVGAGAGRRDRGKVDGVMEEEWTAEGGWGGGNGRMQRSFSVKVTQQLHQLVQFMYVHLKFIARQKPVMTLDQYINVLCENTSGKNWNRTQNRERGLCT